MKHCPHNFFIPLGFNARLSAVDCISLGRVSPFCAECNVWGSDVPELYKEGFGNPYAFGFCDLITQVARKRGFVRDSSDREDLEADLRLRLIEKQGAIGAGIAGKSPEHARNYVLRVLKNFLTDKGKSKSAKVVRNTVASLSPEGGPLTRKQEARAQAGKMLTEITGGDVESAQDDFTLEEKDSLVQGGPDAEPKKSAKRSEAGRLFDKMAAEAASQIATLTGGRQDGFDVRLDLQNALSKLPDDQRSVVEWRWIEDGQLLARARTYPEVQKPLNLSLQNVRTLEFKAVQILRPTLGPSFFKRRSG